MKKFLLRKDIDISFHAYFITAMGAMAYGLFASLLVGTILNSIGQQLNIPFLTDVVWPVAGTASGAAIAVAIAYSLKAPDLVLFSATLVGIGAYELGGPVGVYVATIIATEFGKAVSKETKVDILVTPITTVLIGLLVGTFIGPPIQTFMTWIGEVIMVATRQQPLIMGAVVSAIVGMVLTLPISSAALCMMLGLSGLAGGAATIGCCCQMVGFAVISYRDNGIEGLLAQGLGTSMLQVPNIIKNWKIWIPPTLAAFILGPTATVLFPMENTPLGAGMGTCGLVGQIGTFDAMGGTMPFGQLLLMIVLLQVILPAIVTYIIYFFMKRAGHIKAGDMKLAG